MSVGRSKMLFCGHLGAHSSDEMEDETPSDLVSQHIYRCKRCITAVQTRNNNNNNNKLKYQLHYTNWIISWYSALCGEIFTDTLLLCTRVCTQSVAGHVTGHRCFTELQWRVKYTLTTWCGRDHPHSISATSFSTAAHSACNFAVRLQGIICSARLSQYFCELCIYAYICVYECV